jgi:penicillin amidase
MSLLGRGVILAVACAALGGCAVTSLISYVMWPNYPVFRDGQEIFLPGLQAEVDVTQRADGLWRIAAAHEADGMRVLGYLQARDRMAQLDLFRHIARGELSQLIGLRHFGDKSSLDLDRLNRFLGFRRDAQRLYEDVSAEEQAAFDAFVAGINVWIDEGRVSLDHRLLGAEEIRPWTVEDSLAIYLMIMHGLGSNADREIRRLAIACAAGLDAVERVWPTDIEYPDHALPEEDLGQQFPLPPSVVPAIAAELPGLCGQAAGDEREAPGDRAASGLIRLGTLFETLRSGWSASNNWAVSGQLTRSGKPVLSTDPHLPHMNPPLLWGFDFENPEYRTAGFTLPGLYRVVFGHNGSVAWGATTNHVDRQDLVVHRPRSAARDGKLVHGYEVDGRFEAFDLRTESFEVRDGDPVEYTVRFTRDGPLLNDLTSEVADVLPLVSLRVVPVGRGGDLNGARALARARTTRDFAAAIDQLDLGCSSWVAADTSGSISYRAPCVVPIRQGWSGTFPIPGWLSEYQWKGYYPKAALPASFDPARGWLATANNQIVPADRVPTTYNNDVSAPARFQRIVERLGAEFGSLDVESSAAIQVDLVDQTWLAIRPALGAGFCSVRAAAADLAEEARRTLCEWDGEMAADSVGATLYTLVTNAMLDHALADDFPGGPANDVWRFVQSLVQFEANVCWLWQKPADAPVWDDRRTPERESRDDILERALDDAIAFGRSRYGSSLAEWRWGEVRPFILAHPFAAPGGILGKVLNEAPLPIGGGNETLFKNQFSRSNRTEMKVEVGPIARISVDMSDPWAARFTFAGGQSGWPLSPFYGNLLEDWAVGRTRPLTPPPDGDDIGVRFLRPEP